MTDGFTGPDKAAVLLRIAPNAIKRMVAAT
jgi:hypothetical protein